MKRGLPIRWIQPLIAISIIIGTIAFLQRDVLALLWIVEPIDFIPFFINIIPVSFMVFLRRRYKVVREFWLTPGTTIFWTITIQLIIYLAWLTFKAEWPY